MWKWYSVLAMTEEEFNNSPYVKYGVLALMFGVGVFLVINGIRGIRTGEITMGSRRGNKQFEGKDAVTASWVSIGLGAMFVIVSTLILLFKR